MAYQSRTGRLRTNIGLKKKLLSDRCTNAKNRIVNDISGLDLADLRNLQIQIEADIEHINKGINALQLLDEEWNQELKQLDDDNDFKEEEKLYNAAATDQTTTTPTKVGYLTLLSSAEMLLESLDRFLRKIKAAIETLQPGAAAAGTGAADIAAAFKQLAASLQKNGNCNLPKLELPVFSGKLEENTGFWQAFDINVGSKNISDAEKLTYLLRYVSGEAKAAISYYSVTDANYRHAVDTLKQRFGDPKNIKILLRKKLQEPVTVTDDTKDVRKIIENFEAICRQLEDLGEDTNTIEFSVALRNRIPFWIQEKVQDAEDADPTFDTKKCRDRVLRALKNREDAERYGPVSTAADEKKQKGQKKAPQSENKPAVVAAATQQQSSQGQRNKKNSSNSSRPPPKCSFCGGGHYASFCTEYATYESRCDFIRKNNLCFLCFESGHTSLRCPKKEKINCTKQCKMNHNRALCKRLFQQKASAAPAVLENVIPSSASPASLPAAAVEVKQTSCATNELKQKLTGLLISRHVEIANPNDPSQKIKALVMFDSGGSCSFIKDNFAQQLMLKPSNTTTLLVNRFGGENGKIEVPSHTYSVRLMLKNGGYIDVDTHSTAKILDPIWTAVIESKSKNIIRDPKKIVLTQAEPLLLIGIDYFFKIIKLSNSFTVGDLTWIESLVGPMICGTANIAAEAAHAMLPVVAAFVAQPIVENAEASHVPLLALENITAATVTVDDDKVSAFQNPFVFDPIPTTPKSIVIAIATEDEKVERFFRLEDMKIFDDYVEDEMLKAQLHFDQTVHKIGHRYVVSWPFHDVTNISDNRNMCAARLKSLVDQLVKQNLLSAYDRMLREQIETKFQEIVPESEIDNPAAHYNPHRAVLTPQKTTTTMRIVYDASAATRGKKSLNDCLLNATPQLPQILSMLIYARLHNVIVISDIEKAFLQVLLDPKSSDYVRSLWLKDITKPVSTKNLLHLRFLRMIFGVFVSPWLLEQVIRHHLKECQEKYPHLYELIMEMLNMIYVDNLLQGSDTPEDALYKAEVARNLLIEADMNLRMFQSNCSAVNDRFANTDPMTKLLGINWNLEDDKFIIGWPKVEKCPTTKRELLSFTATPFDPLQVLSPCLVHLKLLIQDLWRNKKSWNETVTADIQQQITELFEEFNGKVVELPRKLFKSSAVKGDYVLHVFADSSGKAYGIAVYLVKICPDESREVGLILAKSRLAPLKPKMTIPKLELTAVALAGIFVDYSLKHLPYEIQATYIWTDSTIVLSWIKDSSEKDRFINNRIVKLRERDTVFRHVPTKINPADIVSRGCSVETLIDQPLWWNGPEFLKFDEENWPTEPTYNLEEHAHVFALPVDVVVVDCKHQDNIIEAETFSSWDSMINCLMIIYMFLAMKFDKFKFIENLPDPSYKSATWKKVCERKMIRQIQRCCSLTDKRMKEIDLFLDDDGFIRRYTRLDEAEGDYDFKHPLFLNACYATYLLILDTHIRLAHASTPTVVAELRQRFYLPRAIQIVKKVLRKCNACKRERSRPFALPTMPALPGERFNLTRPFANVGVDYGGHFFVRVNKVLQKVWICLFTCMYTRAIHLEVVSSSSATDFLQALRRFSARRGRPDYCISDNAGNFTATAKFIPSRWIVERDPEITSYCSSNRITWKFITDRAPWHGGFYERMIGLMKQSLKRTIGRRQPTIDNFTTFVCEVEAVVNSRPLLQITGDATESILRPMDFLQPFISPGLPLAECDDIDNDPDFVLKDDVANQLHHLWQSLNGQIQKFCTIWKSCYLPALRDQMKRFHANARGSHFRRPEVDEVVIIEEPDTAKIDWKLAKVVENEVGDDGEVRSAFVKTGNGRVVKRSVKHLFPLELSTTLLLICLICIVPVANGFECPESMNHPMIVSDDVCMNSGFVFNKLENGSYCWTKMNCPVEMHLRKNDTNLYCGERCVCEEWASMCSFYAAPTSKSSTYNDPHTREIIDRNQPDYCSLTPSTRCAPDKVEKEFYQIQLFDNTLHYVNALRFAITQVHENSVQCLGNGAITGTPEYCQHHQCYSNGTKLCYLNNHEVLNWVVDDQMVEVKAYGIVKAYVYDYFDDLPVLPMQISCKNGTVFFEDVAVHDRFHVKVRADDFVLDSNATSLAFHLPEVYAVSTQELQVSRMHRGKVIDSKSITCEAIDICSRIDCSFCYISIVNFQCTSPITLMVVACILGFVAGLVTYPLGRCCKKRFMNRHPVDHRKKNDDKLPYFHDEENDNELHEVVTDPGGTFVFTNELMYGGTVLCLVALAIPMVQACTQCHFFTANSEECDVTVSGWKTCHYSEATVITMKPNDEACLMLKDDSQRPQQTIRITAEAVAVCKKISNGFTRAVKIHDTSVKRCPGRGSCVENACRDTTPQAKIDELKASNAYPGSTFCGESCGGWGCGCPSFSPGCLFYRVYAVPKNEQPIEEFTCVEWSKQIKLKVVQEVAKQAITREFVVQEGESITLDRVKIAVTSISTPLTSLTSRYFATDGHRTIMLDDITHAAMKLVYCPTKEDAVKLNCTIMFDACSCQPAETRMNCACRDNEMLLDLFDHHSLPRETDDLLLIEAGGNLYYTLANSVVQLQVNVQQLKATTQVDMNSCGITNVGMEGCINCRNGAVIRGSCSTNFGNAIGHVRCDNGWAFSVRCSKPAFNFKATVHAEESEVKTKCALQCPSNVVTFDLEGRLAYVPPPQLRNNIAPVQEVVEVPGFWTGAYEYLVNFVYASYFKIATTVMIVLMIVVLIRCLI